MNRRCRVCLNDLDSSEYSNNQWAKGAGVSRCQNCVADGFDSNDSYRQTARVNDASTATYSRVIFASGTHRNVYRGTYVKGRRSGQPAVHKVFKSGSVFEESYFADDVKTVNKAIEIVERFNSLKQINKMIRVNRAEVWRDTNTGERMLVEPFIEDWKKFNSNSGWSASYDIKWNQVMQALSHFSYHISNGTLLLCDLQGGVSHTGAILTDPVIISSVPGKYGPTDLGARGISSFFAIHRCGQYCSRSWKLPEVMRRYFNPVPGTTMMIAPTRYA